MRANKQGQALKPSEAIERRSAKKSTAHKAKQTREQLDKHREKRPEPSKKRSKPTTVSNRTQSNGVRGAESLGIPDDCVTTMNRKLPPKLDNPFVNEVLLRRRQGNDIETIALRTFNGQTHK